MNNPSVFINLWNLMEFSEKQRLMRTFLRQHGDHFSRDDFLRFLALRYDGPEQDAASKFHRSNSLERSVS